MLSEIVEQITQDTSIIERWKSIVAKDLKAFAKRTSPFKQLKVSGFYFYIDTKTFTYSIVLQGVKPNAARSRGFGAPVDKREPSQPRTIYFGDGWKTVTTKRKTSPSMGVKALDIGYYGTSGKPKEYFGLKRGGKAQAFGLVDEETAVPIYSDSGLVEWIVDDNAVELERILEEAGFKAIENGG